jgi:hypothetical protein
MKQPNCELCDREFPSSKYSEKHHLEPRRRKGETIVVCIDCGNQIHELFTNQELNYTLNTLEALRKHPAMQKWIQWVRKRPFGVCMKRKK